ncbi:nucleoid-structuring protein H-NS [candidate division WOR-1 bacterium RIFOXYA12_FULL_52_29]|uniref:Nucleoid-structuring protein H-NS n=1 Tax=candidate division WOR-1 bacterium RIFOXYC12_FULL_54_18 TaxID=1802584 RepID=A0A1F4T5Y9_UNCSA|nr:MAG: nucleoid-structuring protein H-NS [candidate division WOR-1 bacterium RIFOXYA2_FULL_51_19]OGC17701.1 MAG: nucleoid-structuring protein H-NS [candidate division WOR-1 bacterium RIFOXYA12_FULL_52_29]OGC26558.1 MAG: nucleoid-structuring protein H-NS [candidate division WOR-1 bacterium RIFOXYB2_FULL_45_9]OGC28118.1 MAG: nucleoid-structuring protein H-NS [candidate division WOR-1 bacterium RIFOXYC12_FULL_54_18]OGC29596.1 MAG: nucleoid-structuring protein H-NS [candidate division WOR-1 bacter
MFRPEIKVLDCTIRDGGLINECNFEDKFVRAVYAACSAAGVDYIEVGYQADKKFFSPDKYGKWKFCEESDVRKAIDGIESKSKISTMIDIGRVDLDAIRPKKESVVDMIRVACYVKDVDKAIQHVKACADKGYETTINIMAISTALVPDLEEALKQLADVPVKAVYIVDSFGALYSEQIHFLVALYKKYLNPKGIEVGIHCHNNQQLGFGNTIEAIRKGANYLDATIFGIGRAAGNCPMELLLAFLKNPKFKLEPILEVIETEFIPLREKLEWGYIIPHMITGILNQHPRDAMALRAGKDKDKYAQFYRNALSGAELA